MSIDVSQIEVEYHVEFVRGEGESLAKAQTALISQLAKGDGGGWTYQGFASMTEAVAVCEHGEWNHGGCGGVVRAAAARSSGVMLYFARKPLDLTVMPDGGLEKGATLPEAMVSRAERRRRERKQGGRP